MSPAVLLSAPTAGIKGQPALLFCAQATESITDPISIDHTTTATDRAITTDHTATAIDRAITNSQP